MSAYLFGTTRERLNGPELRRREAIARKHQVRFYYVGPNPRDAAASSAWFAIEPGYGAPFDERIAREVMADVRELGRGRA